jgi:type IV secretory pathway VirB3-like protein
MSVLEPWTSVIRGISEQLTSKEKKKTICFLCFIKAIYLFIHVYIYMTYINQLNDYMYNRIFRSWNDCRGPEDDRQIYFEADNLKAEKTLKNQNKLKVLENWQ